MTRATGPGFKSILNKLQDRKIITPYLDLAITSGKWPDRYTITIDSRPYYGLKEDGTIDGYFHPSTHSQMGARLLWYMVHPEYWDKLEREPHSVQEEMTFAMGSALHGVVQTQFQMLGLCAPNDEEGWSPDVEVEYTNDTHNLKGRNDFTVHHPDRGVIPVELKTRNVRGFAKLDSTVESMEMSWRYQLSLALANLGYDFGILLVLQAGWPYRYEEIPYPVEMDLVDQAYGRFDEAAAGLAVDIPPVHCCSYGSSTMKSCPARFVCYLKDQK